MWPSQVVCCRLTPLQMNIYKHLLSSKEIRHILNGKQTNILSSIGAMQKARFVRDPEAYPIGMLL